jgi:rubrerythrin
VSNLARFSAAEVYDMAIQTEHNGTAFYEAAAQAARTDEVRKLMTMLGLAEVQHEQTFRAMRQESDAEPPGEVYAGETEEYVNALLFSRVLPNSETGTKAVAAMATDVEAIDFALRFEKDTILFMYEMRELVEAAEAARIDALIAQEKNHVLSLSRMREKFDD